MAMEEERPLPAHKQVLMDLLTEIMETEAAGAAGVSALVAAVSSALVGKVAQHTAAREGFEAMNEEMQRVANRAGQLAERLAEVIDQDPQTRLRLTQAFHLPQATPDEAAIRQSCLDLALKSVVQVPLAVAESASEVLSLAENVSRYGSPAAGAEAALGLTLAIAGIKGALAAATGSLKSVDDEGFVEATRAQMAEILEKVEDLERDLSDLPLGV
ncbi:MAG: cyclodeaminase/cyclohydrolase family protein [Cyanobacteria bacterium REEB65]|nr:cyclodeaminase/cyclohydrolase family protein [Cyanobacteria bacterium REEB65]